MSLEILYYIPAYSTHHGVVPAEYAVATSARDCRAIESLGGVMADEDWPIYNRQCHDELLSQI
jgi:hypothetical protein